MISRAHTRTHSHIRIHTRARARPCRALSVPGCCPSLQKLILRDNIGPDGAKALSAILLPGAIGDHFLSCIVDCVTHSCRKIDPPVR